MKLFLLRWTIGFAKIFDGLVMVLTLGFVHPNTVMPVVRAYSKEKYQRKFKGDIKKIRSGDVVTYED